MSSTGPQLCDQYFNPADMESAMKSNVHDWIPFLSFCVKLWNAIRDQYQTEPEPACMNDYRWDPDTPIYDFVHFFQINRRNIDWMNGMLLPKCKPSSLVIWILWE